MHQLTGFQRDLLFVIAGLEKPHGLAIKAELEEYYDNEIHHGRLYPNLDSLVDDGYVEKGKRDRRTNIYELSAAGKDLVSTRRSWENAYLSENETFQLPMRPRANV